MLKQLRSYFRTLFIKEDFVSAATRKKYDVDTSGWEGPRWRTPKELAALPKND